MSSEKALALVVRVVEFSETSVVVTLFSREFGKVSALAKGARRPKGPFESALDLLALVRIVFLHKSSDALDLLTEAKLERRFRVGQAGLRGLYAAYYVAELLRELTDEDDPHPELFDVAERTIRALGHAATAPHHVVALHVLRFETAALRLLGHAPSLDACAECGGDIDESHRVPFGHTAGGVLCRACRPGHRNVVSLSPAGLAALRQLSQEPTEASETTGRSEPADANCAIDPSQAAAPEALGSSPDASLGFDRQVRGELRGLMTHYIDHLLGRELRMHKLLDR